MLILNVSLSFALIFSLNGCAKMVLPNYDVKPFNQYQNSVVMDDLAIAVEPFTNAKKIEEFFGENLLEYNILPVFVFAENRSDSSSFVLQKQRIFLGTQKDIQSINVSQIKAGSELLGQGFIIMAGWGTVLLGMKMVSDAKVVRHNIAKKQFQYKTISPGKTTQGFMFFKIPKQKLLMPKEELWAIRFRPLDLGTNSSRDLIVTFRWENH